MAARVLALLAAVAMVLGALAVRGYLSLGDGGGLGRPARQFTLVCAGEVGDACRAMAGDDARLTVEVEPALQTADRLIALEPGGKPKLDGWLVPGPFPQMVDEVRDLAGKRPLFEETRVVARSPLVVVRRAGATDCTDWVCFGEGAVSGPLALAAPPPSQATGLLVRAAGLTGRVGRSDYSRVEVEDHAPWLAELNRALDRRQFGAGSYDRFIVTPGSATAFATTGAEASRPPAGFEPAIPEPVTVASLTFGIVAGRGSVAGFVQGEPGRDALAEIGWSEGPPSLPDGDGLPSPGVLYALRDFL